MTEYINHGSLKVSKELDDLINKKVCIDIDLEPDNFWANFEKIIEEFTPRNKALLEKREDLQKKIDDWHLANKGKPIDKAEYKNFLKEIGYLLEEPEDFSIETKNVDPEIASIAGPQLVVPVMNARFALNAANARWGSLYDALYGTDVISEEDGAEKAGAYNPKRGAKVIEFSKKILDEKIPLSKGTYI
jgi:malate synthase